jgi:hypothetical protein
LPCNAETIHVEWPIKEGGLCAYAWTDKNGTAFVAVKTLNCIGKTTGIADWQRRDDFDSDMVVGFSNGNPLVMRVHVLATSEGLELTVRMPREVKSARDFIERRFSAWGSGAPTFSLLLGPSFDPYAARSFPTA